MLYEFVNIFKKDVSLLYWLRSYIFETIKGKRLINTKEMLDANTKYRETDIKGIISLLIEMNIFIKPDQYTEITNQYYQICSDKLEMLFVEVFAVLEYINQEKIKKQESSYQIVAKLPPPNSFNNDYMKIKRHILLL